MRFVETKVAGAFVVEPEPIEDERGFFARTWCRREAEEHGLNPSVAQCNISFNLRKGTLRGMHYQAEPHEETKLIRCTRGAIYDVIIDLRPRSSSYGAHVGVELTEDNGRLIYVPEGCAHGFLTMAERTEVCYQMSELYVAEAARGVRWDDPVFGIEWPGGVEVINERDRTYPDTDLMVR